MSTADNMSKGARSSQSSLTAPQESENHTTRDVEKGDTSRPDAFDESSKPADVENATSNEKERAVAPAQAAYVVPDGGLKAWLTVLGAWLVLSATFGYVSSFGVYQAYYSLRLFPNKSSSDISWIGSLQLFLQFSCGAISGPAFDKGHFHKLLAVGSALYIFCLFMLSLCKQYWQVMLAQAIGIGLGNGLLFLPAVTVITHHFAKKRSFVMGIVVTGSSVGGIYYPILLNNLFEKKGFEYGVRTSAYVVLASLLIANLVMRTNYPPKRDVKKPSPATFFKEANYPVAIAGSFFTTLGVFFPIFYIQVYAEVLGVDPKLAFYTVAILNAGSVVGRTIPNAIADKIGVLNTVAPITAINAVLIFAIFGVKSTAAVIVISVLYGMSSGAYVSLIAPMYTSLSKHPSEIGMRIGVAFLIVSVAALLGTPIDGWLLSAAKGKFYGAVIFSGVCVIIGASFLTAARFLTARARGTWKV